MEREKGEEGKRGERREEREEREREETGGRDRVGLISRVEASVVEYRER